MYHLVDKLKVEKYTFEYWLTMAEHDPIILKLEGDKEVTRESFSYANRHIAHRRWEELTNAKLSS